MSFFKPLQSWTQLMRHAHILGVQAPQVIAARTHMMGTQPFDADTAIEAQRMVTEKMLAMGEVWQAWQMAAWSQCLRMPGWPWPGAPRARGAVRMPTLNATLEPFSRRVGANARRLRVNAKTKVKGVRAQR